jgi:hypothetical protein
VTPPGFKTTGGNTIQCAAGDYRADWKPANQATNCMTCGTDVFADTTDRLKVFDINDPTNITYLAITTSADDCCKCLAAAGTPVACRFLCLCACNMLQSCMQVAVFVP